MLCITTWILQSPHFYSAIKVFQHVCQTIHHVNTNSTSADNASHEYKFKSLNTFLTLKCDNEQYRIAFFFMSCSSLFIQLGRSQTTIQWTWLLSGTKCSTYLNSSDNSVQSPLNNHTFGIQPLEALTNSSNAFPVISFHTYNNLLCLHLSK